MRMALLIAASALVAGCSSGAGGPAATTSSAIAPSSSPSATTSLSATTSPMAPPNSAPSRGAAVADVIRWIETGTPADVAGYRSVTRDGEVTALRDGVAFTTAGTVANCITDRYHDGALSCLVKLLKPPPRPPGFPTGWKANWVDFPGATVDVGSPHGDPGPFVDGSGAELPSGQTLAFGDYRCRADPAGLFCVDYAHQSAIGLSQDGVEPFGCLTKTAPPADIGLRFSC